MLNTVGHFIPLVPALKENDLETLSTEMQEFFGCNLCRQTV